MRGILKHIFIVPHNSSQQLEGSIFRVYCFGKSSQYNKNQRSKENYRPGYKMVELGYANLVYMDTSSKVTKYTIQIAKNDWIFW